MEMIEINVSECKYKAILSYKQWKRKMVGKHEVIWWKDKGKRNSAQKEKENKFKIEWEKEGENELKKEKRVRAWKGKEENKDSC